MDVPVSQRLVSLLGLMQRLVGAFAWLMRRTMRTSGPETLAVAANTFVGQTEAPLMTASVAGMLY